MAEQDARLTRIAAVFTLLDNHNKWLVKILVLALQRWDEYRSLFRKLSLAEGLVRATDFPGAVFLIARASGLCTGGSSAGHVYSAPELTPTSTSPAKTLDADARKNPGKHYAYVSKPLKPNWYMVLRSGLVRMWRR
jgi:hypothetical protein